MPIMMFHGAHLHTNRALQVLCNFNYEFSAVIPGVLIPGKYAAPIYSVQIYTIEIILVYNFRGMTGNFLKEPGFRIRNKQSEHLLEVVSLFFDFVRGCLYSVHCPFAA